MAPILIIGAGLSGVTTARILTNSGIPNIVFEASAPDRSQGFAISLRDWGYSALLDGLGGLPLRSLIKAVAPDRYIGVEMAGSIRHCVIILPLAAVLGENLGDLNKAVSNYYDGAWKRCQEAVRRSRGRFYVLHRPIAEWQEIAQRRNGEPMTGV
ncbi:FAD-dependent monooxygenase nscC [Penicillium malachiteum]|uniref:FAD-dependent monooxygenase nscC n=1 Tax=Penicillium malachiteum TaxID=1324776 RepID=UPI002546849A|nr:FAD-dependent monooxygenase nscC [Penicillium malachiteum]KAJ5714343.1 FAD-dependent monooxygenase nscC [Penicillium malachiteum]